MFNFDSLYMAMGLSYSSSQNANDDSLRQNNIAQFLVSNTTGILQENIIIRDRNVEIKCVGDDIATIFNLLNQLFNTTVFNIDNFDNRGKIFNSVDELNIYIKIYPYYLLSISQKNSGHTYTHAMDFNNNFERINNNTNYSDQDYRDDFKRINNTNCSVRSHGCSNNINDLIFSAAVLSPSPNNNIDNKQLNNDRDNNNNDNEQLNDYRDNNNNDNEQLNNDRDNNNNDNE